jgi:predicted nucleic acid-binding protein
VALWTFLDAGVLIAGARGEDADRERALGILVDSERRFVASSFLYLEVAPKAAFHKRRVESAFYERFFRDAKWVRDLEQIDKLARGEAERHGLGAMDALHLAAAHLGGAAELITTEKRSKPIHRSSLVKVVYLYQGR